MFDPKLLYFTKQGKPTLTSDPDALESYVIERTIQTTDWTEEQIRSKFAVDHYLWGRTVNQAVADLVRDCAKHDDWQRS